MAMRLGPFSPPSMVAFSLLLETISATPFVHLVYTDNSTCLDFKAVPACFGPLLSHTGIVGNLVEAVPGNACQPVEAPPASNQTPPGFILLIRRYDCPFGTKVLHAQRAGYQAALIHNLYSDRLVSMDVERPETREQIRIPSLFIGGSASKLLRRHLRSGKTIQVSTVIPRDYENPCWDPSEYAGLDYSTRHHDLRFWPGYCTQRMIIRFLEEFGFLILLGLVLSSFILAGWVKWRHRRHSARTRTFQRGDPYDLCVICMADFEEGDGLKILWCGHAYHHTCIDTWLLIQPKTGKTCPICKQEVRVAT
nr:E3 ubiquitin-protein ligase ZNRF4-like [Pogona vitticeps]